MCYLSCTNVSNCSNHASMVAGNSHDGCNCTCRSSWSGPMCDVCPTFVNSSTDCSTCVEGYGGYPNCRRICTDAADCSAHAWSVAGLAPICNCSCRHAWYGSSCRECPDHVNATDDCGSCDERFDTYPQCYLTCTVNGNCSGNAVAVIGNTNTGCNCSCRATWTGPNCSFCPDNFNSSDDCASCSAGYANYALGCPRICTNDVDCSTHATDVSGLYPHCSCTCRHSWVDSPSVFNDSLCSLCPAQFNQSDDCSGCGEGYEGVYPQCYLTCTTSSNCSSHAASVSGNSATGCNCSCLNMWTERNCSVCPEQFDAAQDCGTCAAGRDGYPACFQVCSVATDCNRHASAVNGTFPNCTCACRNQWRGVRCDVCPTNFNASITSDCGVCAHGFANYPSCVFSCTIASACSSHASQAVGNASSGCKCTCSNQWTGDDCSTCPPMYNANLSCGACLAGYGGYPVCAPLCRPIDCYNHSNSFSGERPNCRCTCRNSWSLGNCSVCPLMFDPKRDCGACAPGYVGVYPNCTRKCTNAIDCGGHAANVSGNVSSGCTCICSNQWTGPQCLQCPAKYNESAGCQSCNQNGTFDLSDYPQCRRYCNSATDCGNHAGTVTGLEGNCTCQCRNQWSGPTCADCASQYDAGVDCGVCAKLHLPDYPNCTAIPSSTLPSRSLSRTRRSPSATLHDETTAIPHHDMHGTRTRTMPEPTHTRTWTHEVVIDPTTDVPSTGNPVTTAVPPFIPTTATAEPSTTVNSTTLVPTATTSEPLVPTPAGDTTPSPAMTTVVVPFVSSHVPPTTTSTTIEALTTAPSSPAPSGTADCSVATSCNGHATSATLNESTSLCMCDCRNFWEGSSCETCPAFLNSSSPAADCSSCVAGRFFPPTCVFAAHVVYGLALNNSCAADYLDYAPRDALLVAMGTDVRDSILGNKSIAGACLDRYFPDGASLLSHFFVVTVNMSTTTSNQRDVSEQFVVTFDVQVLDRDSGICNETASCLAELLLHTPAPPFNKTMALLRSNSPIPIGCFAATDSLVQLTMTSPCGDVLCSAPNSTMPLAAGAAAPSSALSIGVLVGSALGGIVALILLVLGVCYARRLRLGARKSNNFAFADSGRFHRNFIIDGDDELEMIARADADVETNVELPLPAAKPAPKRVVAKAATEQEAAALPPPPQMIQEAPRPVVVVNFDDI